MEPDKAGSLDPLTKVALESLKDIAVPDPVSWMPQTWGWALVAGAIILSLAAFAIHAVRKYRANAYRREALALLDGIEERLDDAATRHEAERQLAEVLKRVALAGWPRTEVAALSGAAWVRFFEGHGAADADRALRAFLDDDEYRGASSGKTLATDDGNDVVSAARNWIRRHDVSA